MAQPTWQDINDKLVSILDAVVPTGRVWDHVRVDALEVQADKAYLNDAGVINAWFVRRIGIDYPEMTDFDEVISTDYVFELEYYRGMDNTDDPKTTSERIFQTQIEDVREAMAADVTLGFGPAVSHRGLRILQPIGRKGVQVGDWFGHRAVCNLRVNVADC